MPNESHTVRDSSAALENPPNTQLKNLEVASEEARMFGLYDALVTSTGDFSHSLLSLLAGVQGPE